MDLWGCSIIVRLQACRVRGSGQFPVHMLDKINQMGPEERGSLSAHCARPNPAAQP